MALLDNLLNLIKSGRLSDSELVNITNAVKEQRPDVFTACLKKIYLTGDLPVQPFQKNYHAWMPTNLKRRKSFEPYLYLQSKEKKVNEEPVNEVIAVKPEEPVVEIVDNRFEKIAVVLIGEWRTGSVVAKYTHKFFDAMAKNVDFYIVTYDNVTLETILESYPQAVVELISREQNDAWPREVFLRRAALCSQALKLIGDKLTEYNQVVETRPDLYMRIPRVMHLLECKENEGTDCSIWYRPNRDGDAMVYLTKYDDISVFKDVEDTYFYSSLDQTKPCYGASDTYIRLHPETFKRYATRYSKYKDNKNYLMKHTDTYPCPHLLTAKALIDYQITHIGHDCKEFAVIRDKHCEHIDLDSLTMEILHHLNPRPTIFKSGPEW